MEELQLVGYGASTTGGAGGTIIEVNNLNDSGAGSLRYAVQQSGARTALISVTGECALSSRITADNGDLSIICVSDGFTLTGKGLTIEADNVIVRNIRVRAGAQYPDDGANDTLQVFGNNIIIDHCCLMFSTDETLDVGATRDGDPMGRNVTIQWCIIAWALNHSTHPEINHSKLVFFETSPKATIHHCLIAHGFDRPPGVFGGRVEVVNNVVYNIYDAMFVNPAHSFATVDFIGNYTLRGADTRNIAHIYGVRVLMDTNASVYVHGNIDLERTSDTMDDWASVPAGHEQSLLTRTRPADNSGIPYTTAAQAFMDVIANVGTFNRDVLEQMVIRDTANGKVGNLLGRIIDAPSDISFPPVRYMGGGSGTGVPSRSSVFSNRGLNTP